MATGPRDHYIRHAVAPHTAPHLGRVGVLGQVSDFVHRGLNVIGSLIDVPAGFELHLDPGAALEGARADAGHAVHSQKRRLHHLDDGGVNIFGPGALPTGRDRDAFHDHIGEELRPHLRIAGDAKRHQDHQQQVGDRGVAGEI